MSHLRRQHYLSQRLLQTGAYVDWRTEAQEARTDPREEPPPGPAGVGPQHHITGGHVRSSPGELFAKGRRNGIPWRKYVWRGEDLEPERASLDAQWEADQGKDHTA